MPPPTRLPAAHVGYERDAKSDSAEERARAGWVKEGTGQLVGVPGVEKGKEW